MSEHIKRTVIFMLVITMAVGICGCGQYGITQEHENSEVTVIMPDDDTVNGYAVVQSTEVKEGLQSTDSQEPSQSTDIVYYANKNSKKFHLSSCAYAKKIKEENLYITQDRQELSQKGYQPCKNCNP